MSFRSLVPVRLGDQHPETGSIPGSSTEQAWAKSLGLLIFSSTFCGRDAAVLAKLLKSR
jgi:hypothetical protein